MARGNAFCALCLGLLFGCAPALWRPTAGDLPEGKTPEELTRGRELYVRHCGGCHRLRRPEKYDPGSWPATVERMNKELRLPPEELAAIAEYLKVAGSRGR